jgi:hypothetical protein
VRHAHRFLAVREVLLERRTRYRVMDFASSRPPAVETVDPASIESPGWAAEMVPNPVKGLSRPENDCWL